MTTKSDVRRPSSTASDRRVRWPSFVRDFGLVATCTTAAREFRFDLPVEAAPAIGFALSATLSSSRTGVGAARDSDSAALATLSMMGFPASNILFEIKRTRGGDCLA